MKEPNALIVRAAAFAKEKHEGQKRKYTDEDYIVHPTKVADLLCEARMADEVIAAAFLHDVVEDCGVTVDEIRERFGDVVARYVEEVTDVSRPEDGNRAKRKRIDLEHLAKASSEAKSIKLADLIDNTSSITRHDPDFADVYMAEKWDLLRVLIGGHYMLWNTAFSIAFEYFGGKR